MHGRKSMASSLAAAIFVAFLVSDAAGESRHSRRVLRAEGPTRLGPWVREAWNGGPEGFAYDPGPIGVYPATDEWYPWGYTAPFVRVGRLCVANEINASPGGDYVRYQRVRPSYYCDFR